MKRDKRTDKYHLVCYLVYGFLSVALLNNMNGFDACSCHGCNAEIESLRLPVSVDEPCCCPSEKTTDELADMLEDVSDCKECGICAKSPNVSLTRSASTANKLSRQQALGISPFDTRRSTYAVVQVDKFPPEPLYSPGALQLLKSVVIIC